MRGDETRTRSSSILARNAVWQTTLVCTPRPRNRSRSWRPRHRPACRRGSVGPRLSSARAYSVRNAVCSDGCQFGGGIPHDRERTPFSALNVLPKTFTALAITGPCGGPWLFVSLAPFGFVGAVLRPLVLELFSGCTLGRRFITRLSHLGAVAGSHCGSAMLSAYKVLRTTKTPNSARRVGHGGAEHAENQREMYDGDSTEASIRRLLDLPERPPAHAHQVHHEFDGEDDEHDQAPGFHLRQATSAKPPWPFWSSTNRMTPRKRPCAAEKTRLVTRNPLTNEAPRARRRLRCLVLDMSAPWIPALIRDDPAATKRMPRRSRTSRRPASCLPTIPRETNRPPEPPLTASRAQS